MTPVEQDPDRLEVLDCLGPYRAERMTGYPVAAAVNAVANDGPALVEPLRQAADVLTR